jgi:hypothetical protein
MTEAIWQSIPGAQPLHELYGYWPTLHDAWIRAMRVGCEGRELTMVLDYPDTPNDNDNNLYTCFTMRWHGVVNSSLRIEQSYLYGVEFSQTDAGILTTFVPTNFGTCGTILAAGIEVSEIGPTPDTETDVAILFEIEPPT